MWPLFRQREGKCDELLSAYLDDQLSERERERLEARLADDPALRADLEALRRTVSLVRDLPPTPAPRNFILTPTMVKRTETAPSPRPRMAPLLTAATAVVSFLFAIVLVGDLLLPGMGGMTSAPAEMRRAEESPEMALEASKEGAGEEEGEQIEAPTVATPSAPTAEMMLEEAAPAPKEEEKAEGAADSQTLPADESSPSPEMGAGNAMTESVRLAPTAAVTVTEEPVTLPTVSAEASPVPEETVGVVEAAPDDFEVTPSVVIGKDEGVLASPVWPWRALEVALGLTALGLAFATIWAWRARR